MFSKKTFSTNVKVVMMIMMILTLLIFNSKPVEATRPLVAVMKSKKVETTKVVSVSQDRAPVTPSEPNPCTYLPDPANGSEYRLTTGTIRTSTYQNIKYEYDGSVSDHNTLAKAIKRQIYDELSSFLGLYCLLLWGFSSSFSPIDTELNLEEREEGEGGRKVASDNELNFRQEAERLVRLYQGSSQCLCSCCRKNLSNDQQGLTPCVFERFCAHIKKIIQLSS
ncbi:hypothetical protein CMV_017082 [Castanea mollissima]|uniref:Uncharacterized protein n=1 Tax=Castanea mollissima TaxID=60419 RepID=A0A8J4VR16_9ROSI|nr:hypothetical protein CMV_017082 [Castanea mollissima]